MDIRYLSYLSFCHAIPKLRSYCYQKLKLSLKFSYKYWTHCKTLSKTIQSLYFSLIFIFQSLKLEFERLSIFQKFSESFTKYLIRTFIHFNWPVDYCFALVANWNSSQLKASASSRAEAKGWNAALAQPQSYLTARQPKERIHWSGRRNKQKVKIIKE